MLLVLIIGDTVTTEPATTSSQQSNNNNAIDHQPDINVLLQLEKLCASYLRLQDKHFGVREIVEKHSEHSSSSSSSTPGKAKETDSMMSRALSQLLPHTNVTFHELNRSMLSEFRRLNLTYHTRAPHRPPVVDAPLNHFSSVADIFCRSAALVWEHHNATGDKQGYSFCRRVGFVHIPKTVCVRK